MNEQQSSQADLIISLLEKVRSRPLSYFSDGMYAVFNFLHGFNIACSLFGVEIEPDEIYKKVVQEHGWEWSTLAPFQEMTERGLNTTEITEELLTIQIEYLNRKFKHK